MNPPFHRFLVRGVELFNRQEFYEAHEAWEEGWIDELSDDRLLLQGLIQIAAGFYKLQTGAPRGTVKLLEAGLAKLRPFRERSFGLDLNALVPAVEQWHQESLEMVQTGRADYDPLRLPRISYSPSVGDG